MKSIAIRHLPAWVVNGITVTLGLALVQCSISLVAGAQAAQLAIATAVCASLADVVTTTDRVARRVLVAVIASTVSATLFLALRPYGMLLVPTVAVIMFAAMLLLSWGPKAGTVSFAAALSLVFAMSTPQSQGLSWNRVAWGLVGSAGYWIWAVATARLLQPTWRNLALASTAEGMARLLAAIGRQIGHPTDAAWQSGILDEEAVLADRLQVARDLVFPNDAGPKAGRETALLLHLIDLRDLAMASNLEAGRLQASPAARRQAELLGETVARIADALRAIADHLRTGRGPVVDVAVERAIQDRLDALQRAAAQDPDGARPGVGGLLENKLGLLRAIQRLLDPQAPAELPCQREDLRRYITPDEWRLEAVAANLRPRAPVFRHALRTCITATAAYWLSGLLPWTPHPQWILLTIAAVMQGSLAQTLLRRNARVLGSLVGCVVVVVLASHASGLFVAACFLVAAGVAHAFFGIRYGVTAGAATVMAVLQAHLVAPGSGFSTLERLGDTVAGALLGWAATYVLPTWERRSLLAVLRRATDALRAYAAEASAPREDNTGLPRFARQQAYDALRALAAIRSRSLVEPAQVRVPVAELTAWLAAAYGLMSHLSSVRLSLTLYAREHDEPTLAAAMAELSRQLSELLAMGAKPDRPPPVPDAALAAVPHLASRVRRLLEEASHVAAQSALIEALVGASAQGAARQQAGNSLR